MQFFKLKVICETAKCFASCDLPGTGSYMGLSFFKRPFSGACLKELNRKMKALGEVVRILNSGSEGTGLQIQDFE